MANKEESLVYIKSDNYNPQLLEHSVLQLKQHEEHVQSLFNICSDNKLLSQHLIQMTENIISILNQLQADQLAIKDAFKQIEKKFNFSLDDVKKEYEKIFGNYIVINKEQSNYIRTLEEALKGKNVSTLIKKIKSFCTPKLGLLTLYSSRKMIIPKYYFNTEITPNPMTISIVTPSYNQANYIENTILSVLCQKYPSLEYIIQDGESTDNSIDIIKRFATSLKSFESKKDTGQSNAINLGFKKATGDIMAYLNSDDLLLPGTLHYVANYFSKHPEVDVIYGHRVLIDEHDHEIGRWILPPHDNDTLSWADYIPQETLFWRKSIWEKVGGQLDENFRFAMDWDLILRFRAAGAKFVRLPRFLGAFRVHSEQKTSLEICNSGQKEMDSLRQRCHGKKMPTKVIRQKLMLYKIKHLILHRLYRLGILRY